MTIHFSFAVIVLLVSIITGILGMVILVSEKANKEANKYLVFLLLAAVGPLIHNFLIASGIYDQKPGLYFLPVIYSLGIGPLLYLYVNRLINIRPVKKKEVILHLLPLLAQVIFYFYCFVQNKYRKYELYSEVYEPFVKDIVSIAVYISVAIYLYLSFREINRYKQKLNFFYSNDSKLALRWLRQLLFLITYYYILLIFFIILANAFHLSENYFPADLARGIIIFMIGFFAVKQNSLIEMQQNLQGIGDPIFELKIEQTEGNSEQENISFKETEPPTAPLLTFNTELLEQIITVTENEKLFLNEELTIADLANKLNRSTKTISSTINKGLGKSFSLFINEYRVNLFIEKKASGQFDHLSIMGLAYDCGFNSKSTFNRIFKEITGTSPKDVLPVLN